MILSSTPGWRHVEVGGEEVCKQVESDGLGVGCSRDVDGPTWKAVRDAVVVVSDTITLS
jgi:hypothetical protein